MEIENRTGYKKTKLGWIPEEWNVKKLGEVITNTQSGLSRKLSIQDIGIPVIRSNNIDEKGINFKSLKYWYVPDPQGAKIENYYLKHGDLLVNFINSTSQIGKTAKFVNRINREVIFTTNILRIRSTQAIIDLNYLLFITKTGAYYKHINHITKPAINQASFTVKEFLQLKIPLPPLPEQKKIADILTTVDEKIESIDQQIEQTEQLKKGLMQRLFTQGIGHSEFKDSKLGRIPKEWNVGILNTVAEIILGQSPPGNSYNTNKIGIPILNGPTEFTNFSPIPIQYTTHKTKVCKCGDILFCVRGSSTGRMNIADQEYCIGRGLAAIRGRKYSITSFVYYILEKIAEKILIEAKGAGSTFPNITGKDFKEKMLAIPPLPEQKQIANILSAADEKLQILQSKKAQYTTLKKGLMQKLLTGQIRVKI